MKNLNEKDMKIKNRLLMIPLIGMFIGGGILTYSYLDKRDKMHRLLNEQQIIYNERDKIINAFQESIELKTKATTSKIEILNSINKLLNKNSNQWNIIYNLNLNNFKTVDLYGYSRSEESKKHIISIISQVPGVYVIRENIQVDPARNWQDLLDEEFPKYDKTKDVIRPDVKVISYKQDDFLKLQESSPDTIKNEAEINNHILKEVNKALFDDPLLYKEITDIKVFVTERVPEVYGIVSTNAHKDRITSILKTITSRNNEIIYSFINNVTTLEDKVKNSNDSKEEQFNKYVNLIRSEAKKQNLSQEELDEVDLNIKVLEGLIKQDLYKEGDLTKELDQNFKNLSKEIINKLPQSIKELEKQQSTDIKIENVINNVEKDIIENQIIKPSTANTESKELASSVSTEKVDDKNQQ